MGLLGLKEPPSLVLLPLITVEDDNSLQHPIRTKAKLAYETDTQKQLREKAHFSRDKKS